MYPIRIARAENDLIFDEHGRRYIDLFTAHGTAWLGHLNREVAAQVALQLEKVWITGGLETAVGDQARELVGSFFPPTHDLAILYSTGMEAAEFAIRVARAITGKNGVVGFEKGMHGKSLATAYLGWDNHDDLRLPGFFRLPFVPDCPEDEVLVRLEDVLANQPVSAVFVEPLHGCGGGHRASDRFYRAIFEICAQKRTLLVFDEILTGFYRTGSAFFFSDLGFVPDIVLIGKSIGNGFPVSGVVVDKRYPIRKEMLPGSTYSGNPLAASAVAATVGQFRSLDLPGRVAGIENAIARGLGPLRELGISLRGKGALWILEMPPGWDVEGFVINLFRRGVAVGFAGKYIRILPAATIEPGRLSEACSIICEELARAYHERLETV